MVCWIFQIASDQTTVLWLINHFYIHVCQCKSWLVCKKLCASGQMTVYLLSGTWYRFKAIGYLVSCLSGCAYCQYHNGSQTIVYFLTFVHIATSARNIEIISDLISLRRNTACQELYDARTALRNAWHLMCSSHLFVLMHSIHSAE